MSFLSSTIGTIYRAATGNVDPWTLRDIKQETRKDIAKAGSGLPPAVVKEAQEKADREIDGYLLQIEAHPKQAGLRIPGLGVLGSPEFLKKLQSLLILAVAGILLLYFGKVVVTKLFRERS